MVTRKSILAKYGIRVPTIDQPWTKDEFAAGLTKIKDSGDFDYPLDMATSFTGEWWPYAYSPFLQSFGGDLINRDDYKTAEGVLNGPQAVEWATWFRRLVTNGVTPLKSGTDPAKDFINGKSGDPLQRHLDRGRHPQEVRRRHPLPAVGGPGSGPEDRWRLLAVGHLGELRTGRGRDGLHEVRRAGQVRRLGRHRHHQHPGHRRRRRAPSRATSRAATTPSSASTARSSPVLRPETPGYPFIATGFTKTAQDILNGADAKKALDQPSRTSTPTRNPTTTSSDLEHVLGRAAANARPPQDRPNTEEEGSVSL